MASTPAPLDPTKIAADMSKMSGKLDKLEQAMGRNERELKGLNASLPRALSGSVKALNDSAAKRHADNRKYLEGNFRGMQSALNAMGKANQKNHETTVDFMKQSHGELRDMLTVLFNQGKYTQTQIIWATIVGLIGFCLMLGVGAKISTDFLIIMVLGVVGFGFAFACTIFAIDLYRKIYVKTKKS